MLARPSSTDPFAALNDEQQKAALGCLYLSVRAPLLPVSKLNE